MCNKLIIWALSSEFVSSSILSWQILTAHAQPFREARDLAFCLKVPLDSLLVWASSGGSGETARMRRLAWTFAARIGDKYQIRLARSICSSIPITGLHTPFCVYFLMQHWSHIAQICTHFQKECNLFCNIMFIIIIMFFFFRSLQGFKWEIRRMWADLYRN